MLCEIALYKNERAPAHNTKYKHSTQRIKKERKDGNTTHTNTPKKNSIQTPKQANKQTSKKARLWRAIVSVASYDFVYKTHSSVNT